VSGRPELHGVVRWSTTAPSTWTDGLNAALGLRPLQWVSPGLTTPTTTADPSLAWVAREDGQWGAVLGWVDPPAYLVDATAGLTGSWLAANELGGGGAGPTDAAPAGAVLVDGRHIVVLPFEGTLLDHGATLDALLDAPSLQQAGVPEAL
jgi:hypothetical protein